MDISDRFFNYENEYGDISLYCKVCGADCKYDQHQDNGLRDHLLTHVIDKLFADELAEYDKNNPDDEDEYR